MRSNKENPSSPCTSRESGGLQLSQDSVKACESFVEACKSGDLERVKKLWQDTTEEKQKKSMLSYPLDDMYCGKYLAFQEAFNSGHLLVVQWLWEENKEHLTLFWEGPFYLLLTTSGSNLFKRSKLKPHCPRYTGFHFALHQACEKGFKDLAMWLWELSGDIEADENLKLRKFTRKGLLLWDNNLKIFGTACVTGHLDLAKALWNFAAENGISQLLIFQRQTPDTIEILKLEILLSTELDLLTLFLSTKDSTQQRLMSRYFSLIFSRHADFELHSAAIEAILRRYIQRGESSLTVLSELKITEPSQKEEHLLFADRHMKQQILQLAYEILTDRYQTPTAAAPISLLNEYLLHWVEAELHEEEEDRTLLLEINATVKSFFLEKLTQPGTPALFSSRGNQDIACQYQLKRTLTPLQQEAAEQCCRHLQRIVSSYNSTGCSYADKLPEVVASIELDLRKKIPPIKRELTPGGQYGPS